MHPLPDRIKPGETPKRRASRRPPAPGTAPRKPRAIGLSRDRIVTETVRYLRQHPTEQLTIARAGAAVGATSMAIYRHFRDGADLADAILAEVLDGLSEEIPRDGDWRVQVRSWMEAIYRRLVETPQSAGMLTTGNGLSVAWVRATVVLHRCLRAGGVDGTRLADAMFWVSLTVGGFAQLTLATPLATQIDGTIAAIDRLEPDEIAELASTVPEVPRMYNQAIEIMFERTLASIEMLIAGKG
jgi:AcrR family transcriptional regulator